VNHLREWMEEHLPPWSLGLIDWPGYRLLGDCWAEECPVASRRTILHTPQQLRRCEGTPMAIELTDQGWLYANGIEPVVPVSHAKPA
jgi:hypothetical protein